MRQADAGARRTPANSSCGARCWANASCDARTHQPSAVWGGELRSAFPPAPTRPDCCQCVQSPMPITGGVPPIVLIATVRQQALASALLEGGGCSVIHVQSAAVALEQAAAFQPDAIILETDLPDMSGIEVCRLLHADPRVGYRVPILLLAAAKPTPEQRVAALRAGAWDFFVHPADPEELSLKLQTYVQAKRNIDVAAAEGLVDPVTGLLSRPGLARRARELGALMTRKHGALACVVFAVEAGSSDPKVGDRCREARRARHRRAARCAWRRWPDRPRFHAPGWLRCGGQPGLFAD